jgi:hypothetical protein
MVAAAAETSGRYHSGMLHTFTLISIAYSILLYCLLKTYLRCLFSTFPFYRGASASQRIGDTKVKQQEGKSGNSGEDENDNAKKAEVLSPPENRRLTQRKVMSRKMVSVLIIRHQQHHQRVIGLS